MMSVTPAEQQFERTKNLKAFGITVGITAGVFLLFLVIGWTIPQLPPEPVDQGVVVAFGNSDFGSGPEAPKVPGDPAPEEKATTSAPPPAEKAVAEAEAPPIPNNDANATPVNTAPKPPKKPKPKAVQTQVVKVSKPKAEAPPVPKPRVAAAVMHKLNSTGAGGDNADSYDKPKSSGTAGGSGYQGKETGSNNSNNFTGSGGSGASGFSISQGLEGRRIIPRHFEDSYRYGGVVLVNVTIDPNGNVTNASVQLGSPFEDLNRIAMKRAYQLKFSSGSDTQSGVVQIKFETPRG